MHKSWIFNASFQAECCRPNGNRGALWKAVPALSKNQRRIIRRFAMKATYKVAALFSLAAFLSAAAQMEVNPRHDSEHSASVVQASQPEAEISTLRQNLEGYEQQLRAKFELVEEARQEAISAGIQGDGAQAYIDAYRREQREADSLRAALTPQIEHMRATIAALSRMDSQASPVSQKTDSGKAEKNSDLTASRTASNLRAAAK
jgi:hypothetical protein